MAPYALAKIASPPGKRLISLAQNESAAPPSPKAVEAAARAMGAGALYPDPDWTELREAIAGVHGLPADDILCGAGSMELIGGLIQAYAGPGDEVLAGAYSYAFFRTAAELAEAAYVTVPERDFTVDVDLLLQGVTSRTRVVCLANPGNPTGTVLPGDEVRKLRDRLPPDVLLLIDEAYGEFADAGLLFDLVGRGDTVVTRTFSKAYALAGLRVGWGLFPPAVVAELRKILNPNNISGPAQAAAAAAMRDQAHMQSIVEQTNACLRSFSAALRGIGVEPVDSQTNFVLIPFADEAAARSADLALRAEGIVMRGMGGYGLGHCLRATIGTESDMTFAAQVLGRWKKGGGE